MFLRLRFLMGLSLCLEHQFKNEAPSDWMIYPGIFILWGFSTNFRTYSKCHGSLILLYNPNQDFRLDIEMVALNGEKEA